MADSLAQAAAKLLESISERTARMHEGASGIRLVTGRAMETIYSKRMSMASHSATGRMTPPSLTPAALLALTVHRQSVQQRLHTTVLRHGVLQPLLTTSTVGGASTIGAQAKSATWHGAAGWWRNIILGTAARRLRVACPDRKVVQHDGSCNSDVQRGRAHPMLWDVDCAIAQVHLARRQTLALGDEECYVCSMGVFGARLRIYAACYGCVH